MEKTNRQIILYRRPENMPDQSNFKIVNSKMPPDLIFGEVLVQADYLSVDPYMRWRMNEKTSYSKTFIVGEPIYGGGVGKVVESKHPGFEKDDLVTGYLDWADYTVKSGNELAKVDDDLDPVTAALHVVGMPGLTAYFGLLDIGKPKKSETVVVSGAAGAVGMVVGQIAKKMGCHVVGIAGNDEKIKYLNDELKFDVINYKETKDIASTIKTKCPNGVDIYFDNVGGEISDAICLQMNFHGRVILCGQISQYNTNHIEHGPRLFPYFVQRRVMTKGFIVSDYESDYEGGKKELKKWVKSGDIKFRESYYEGLENTPNAFLGLFHGENIGKQLVRLT